VTRNRPLQDKVVLVTGAARGIGAETAKELARRGARLVLTDLDAEPLQAVVASVGSDVAMGVVADVCDLHAMERAVAAGVSRFGGVDVVVANAGIASYGSILAVDPATFRRVVDVNVNGVFHTVRAALPSLIERKGYVLVVSSLAAFAPAPGLAAYNASKAAAEQLANALRVEVDHYGVAVGTAHMSWVDTPLVQDAKRDLSSFRDLVEHLPFPLNRTSAVDPCIQAFVAAIERRRRRVYFPGWVGLVAQARMLLASPLGDLETRRRAPRVLPTMDAEVRRLGRSTAERNVAMAERPEAAST
jgi:NAD(P)-dependent dehydrogenase (short-subunit alcohol dehydrogenase family)